MKKLGLAALLLLLAVSSSYADAVGSAFGTLTTAQSLGQGRGNIGFGLGLADATSFTGTFSYGLSKYTDGRLRLGLVDPGKGVDTKVTIGADFKWQFWNVGPNTTNPFDFAIGGFFEYVDYSYLSVFQVGGQLIGSYPVRLNRGGILVPYGRFNARIESLSLNNTPPGVDASQTNLEIGLNGGVKWEMTSTVSLFGEFQIDGNDGFFFGADFNIM